MDNNKTARVLVLLTCFNRKGKTINCINSLLSQKQVECNFIVVDDRSSDGTAEALKNYSEVKLISSNGKCFYSKGMGIAIDAAKNSDLHQTDYVMLVNDDVSFYDNSIIKLVHYLDSEDAIMVGATDDGEGKLSYGGVIITSKFKPQYQIVMSNDTKVNCDTFNANCVLIPANLFFKFENIDQIYEHAMGDFDYGLAAHRMGAIIYASNFFVGKCIDNDPRTTWRESSKKRRERLRMKEAPKGLPFKQWFHYLHKNHGLFVAIIYSIVPYAKIALGMDT